MHSPGRLQLSPPGSRSRPPPLCPPSSQVPHLGLILQEYRAPRPSPLSLQWLHPCSHALGGILGVGPCNWWKPDRLCPRSTGRGENGFPLSPSPRPELPWLTPGSVPSKHPIRVQTCSYYIYNGLCCSPVRSLVREFHFPHIEQVQE